MAGARHGGGHCEGFAWLSATVKDVHPLQFGHTDQGRGPSDSESATHCVPLGLASLSLT